MTQELAGGVQEGMAWVGGGEFLMGSENYYPEERPLHRVAVDGFWIDEHPVTDAELAASWRRRST